MRVSDFIAKRLKFLGCEDVYMVTGGASMHLNDSFGIEFKKKVHCLHHEQACTIAAESYARIKSFPAIVNVTAGPGGINAINGVFGAYVDSIPMIVISGQAKRETLVKNSGRPHLRQLGDQEVDIIHMVQKVTKESIILEDPSLVSQVIDFAFLRAISGRKGPVWIDIPIDVQSTLLDQKYKNLLEKPIEVIAEKNGFSEPFVSDNEINLLAKKILQSHRPTLYVGNGIRLSDAYDEFLRFIDKWPISTVTGWNSNDLLWDDHYCYSGRPGSVGNRAGNFAVQFSDCLITVGCRLNIRQVSFNWKSFAKNAWRCHVDIDQDELEKPTLNTNLKIKSNIKGFFEKLDKRLSDYKNEFNNNSHSIHWEKWRGFNKKNLKEYPATLPCKQIYKKLVNPYFLIDSLFEKLKPKDIVVCADGTACVVTFQAAKIKKGQRIFHNSGCASMGYEIPAAIGAFDASNQEVICIAGDGSLMMNLQELSIIGSKNLPIKIFLLNNDGYHSIRQTQKNYFPNTPVGCGVESGLPFPNFQELAKGFNIKYFYSDNELTLNNHLEKTLNEKGPVMHEIKLNLEQVFEPKLSSKKLEDGTMLTSELEDMAPFLSDEIMSKIKKKAFEI